MKSYRRNIVKLRFTVPGGNFWSSWQGSALGQSYRAEKAFVWLEKSYEERFQGLIGNYIKVSPAYDPLRSDPRFQDLLRRMNLQP